MPVYIVFLLVGVISNFEGILTMKFRVPARTNTNKRTKEQADERTGETTKQNETRGNEAKQKRNEIKKNYPGIDPKPSFSFLDEIFHL